MNWIDDYVRPKLRSLVGGSIMDSAENKWQSCPGCSEMLFIRDLPEDLYVCKKCGYHLRMPALLRLEALMDDGYEMLPEVDVAEDPLKFKDEKRYVDRLKASRAKTQTRDVLQCAYGTVHGEPCVAAAFEFGFMGGSMGDAVGAAFVQATNKALDEKCAFVVFTASGGARMQEGILSLMQLPRTVIALEMLTDAGLPYIVVLCDPTTGGVTASFAMLGDLHLAEPGATIGFAGRRVIEQTVRETLPDGFQIAEHLLDKGMVDMVVHRKDMAERLGLLLTVLAGKRRPNQDISPPETAENSGE